MAETRATRPGEFALIERYFRPLATAPGAFGLVDDAALYRPAPGEELVLTVDTVAEGIHFLPEDAPAAVARKALRVNLSDLAAKGARPVAYLLALALPEDWTEEWVAGFVEGLAGDQKAYGIELIGGDTTRASGGVTISITAIGSVPKGEMVRRSGARPGDAVFVSGTLGDAALGLATRSGRYTTSQEAGAYLRDRYLHPQPRLALAPVLRRFATGAMDVSDGLLGDLAHICEASGVSAEIEAASVPLSQAARSILAADASALVTVVTGGDDYEILATVREEADFAKESASAGVPVTRIGRIVDGRGPPVLLDAEGKAMVLAGLGHTHF